MKADLEKTLRQHGGKPGEDMTKLPPISFQDRKLDPITMEVEKK